MFRQGAALKSVDEQRPSTIQTSPHDSVRTQNEASRVEASFL
jgi:hypothetical protein